MRTEAEIREEIHKRREKFKGRPMDIGWRMAMTYIDALKWVLREEEAE